MTVTASIATELSLRHSRTRESIRHWCARAATSSSVVRVFERGTKDELLRALLRVPIKEMPRLGGRHEFEEWFEKQLDRIARAISSRNKANPRVNPGMKWGHAAKVLAIYLREVVLRSRFFNDAEADRIALWLFVPVDSKIIERLSELGVRLPFKQIRQIATKKNFTSCRTC